MRATLMDAMLHSSSCASASPTPLQSTASPAADTDRSRQNPKNKKIQQRVAGAAPGQEEQEEQGEREDAGRQASEEERAAQGN
jgi:hypothetical protein